MAYDTATTVASAALVRDGDLVAEAATRAIRELTRLIDELVADPAELDGIVVGTGPGSFTSIRIGLSTLRGLVLALGIPAAGVSTLYAFQGGLPVIDARRGEVFTEGPTVARPDELDVVGRTLVGDGAVRYRDIFEAAGATVPPDDDDRHVPHAHLLVPHAGELGPADLVEPLYLRIPDAEKARS